MAEKEQNIEDTIGKNQLKEEVNKQPKDQLAQQEVEMTKNAEGGNEIVAENVAIANAEGQGPSNPTAVVGEEQLYECFYGLGFSPTLLESFAYEWTIADISEKLNREPFELESVVFSLKSYHFSAKAKLTLDNKDEVNCSICFVNTSDRHLLPNQRFPQLTCVLKDANSGRERRHRIRAENCTFNSTMMYNRYCYKLPIAPKSLLTSPIYNSNDSVTIVILLEPPSVMYRFLSTNGSITQHVRNFSKRLQLAKDRYLEYHSSDYFSTHVRGHRMHVKLWLDGQNDSTRSKLIAQLFFIGGQFDRKLGNVFKYKAVVRVVNQQKIANDIVERCSIHMGHQGRIYSIELGTSEVIQRDGFILNDCLIYQIDIKVDKNQLNCFPKEK